MKALRRTILPVVCLALMMSSASKALAQANKPMAVISVTSLDNLFGGIRELAEVAGFGKEFAQVDPAKSQLTKAFLNGVDTTKAAGIVVKPGAGPIPDVLGFVPVTNMKTFVGVLQQARVPIKATDNAGEYEIAFGPFFAINVKESKGYAFVATNKNSLANPPANPAALLDGLDKKYAFGFKVNVQAIPAQQRALAKDQIKTIMKQALSDPNIDEELAKRMQASYEKAFTMLIEESESFTIGLGIDRKTKSAFFDFGLTAVSGSKFAKQITASSDVSTGFAGFNQSDAAAALSLTSKIVPEEIASSKAMIQAVQQKILAELDGDESLDANAKGPVKEFAKSITDLVINTIGTGKIDGGAVLLLKPKQLQLAAGGHIADGKALEAAIKKLVKAAQADENFPKVKYNASKYGDVTFHTTSFPVPADDEDAQKILGKELQLALGIGPKVAYFGLGTDSVGLIKKVIDGSKKAGAKQAGFKLRASIGQILNFAKSIEDDPAISAMAAAVAKSSGKDNVILEAGLKQRSVTYQIKVEEGVIRVIGAAIGARVGN